MRVAGLAALTVAMLAGACVSAAAQDYEKVWDVGLDPGMIYPTGHRQFSATVPNNLDYSITGSESLSEEESEGFVLPPLNGSSSIGGSISPMPELAMHVYRRVSDSWSVGALFGWSGVHQGFVDSQGVYDQPGFTRLGFSS